MPNPKLIRIKELSLDLENFRTVKQQNEIDAINAMIAVSPDWFWALMDSIIDTGYLPTDNIIVMENDGKNIVKEGNRRIACLKIIFGNIGVNNVTLAPATSDKINNLTKEWREENEQVPCLVFSSSEKNLVDKIITRAHGKGDKASRDNWTSVAKARHNRDINSAPEHSLTLLESFLANGRNITPMQAERWAGDYPLTVLDEAMKKISARLEEGLYSDLVGKYPSIKYRDELESIMLAIGLKNINFEKIRSKEDFALHYNIPQLQVPPVPSNNRNSSNPSSGGSNPTNNNLNTQNRQPTTPPSSALDTNKSVIEKLRRFSPRGPNREKITTIKEELIKLDSYKTPIAFCFLLRSIFEISAKAYLTDNNISHNLADGREKKLVRLLTDAKDHIISQKPLLQQQLHGAISQLSNPKSILSVTSLNQLVHNPSFSVLGKEVCVLFHNIYPLLEAMN